MLGNYQAGHSQLQSARKLKPGVGERYVMYVRDQEHTSKMQTMGADGDSSLDLVSYLEFARNWKWAAAADHPPLSRCLRGSFCPSFVPRLLWNVLAPLGHHSHA